MQLFSLAKSNTRCLRRSIALLGSCLLLAGCEQMSSSTLPIHFNSEPPIFTQNQEVTLYKPFEIKIDKCYWADEFVKPGYDKLPETIRAAQRQNFVATPSGKFLIVEFSLLNPTDQPLAWNRQKPLTFMLKNAAGRQYASVGQNVNYDDLSAKMILGSGNINPDVAFKGKKVFDVPKDDYLLCVGRGTHTSGWSYAQGPVDFKWSLAPVEGR